MPNTRSNPSFEADFVCDALVNSLTVWSAALIDGKRDLADSHRKHAGRIISTHGRYYPQFQDQYLELLNRHYRVENDIPSFMRGMPIELD
jgi:hypothetical protein